MDYIKDIERFTPLCEQEVKDKKKILELYQKYGDQLLSRECEEAHFSSSALVFDKSKEYVLFAYHNIYKSWSWLGGHVDLNDNFCEVAIKEVQEESGLEKIDLLTNKIISLEILPVCEHIKNGKLVKSHVHLNVTYIFEGNKEDNIRIKPDENSAIKWIKISEIDNYSSEEVMKPIYHKIVERMQKLK